MIFKDYYKILGLETNKVSIDEIKTAYREQAKKYHPDVNVGDKSAEERFKDINEAYNNLLNPSTRRKYDRMWNTHIGRKKNKTNQTKQKSASRGDIFNILFGLEEKEIEENKKTKDKNVKVPIQGEDVETEIPISIIEGFFGLTKKISLRTVNGKMKTFTINIPAGIKDGEKVRLIGQGRPGENGGKNGDLLIKISMSQDKKYKLIGSDIYTELNISPSEAVLGTKVNVDAVDETIGVYVPQGIETDETIQIENKGYKDGKGGRGKFIIKVKIMIPKNISEKEKELYKEIKKISKFNPREL
ncbi:MAG: DnaJ C-terminal domain-containing protein [Clostridia bacterium]